MRKKREFDAKKAVRNFYAGKRKKLPQIVGTDRQPVSTRDAESATALSNILAESIRRSRIASHE